MALNISKAGKDRSCRDSDHLSTQRARWLVPWCRGETTAWRWVCRAAFRCGCCSSVGLRHAEQYCV